MYLLTTVFVFSYGLLQEAYGINDLEIMRMAFDLAQDFLQVDHVHFVLDNLDNNAYGSLKKPLWTSFSNLDDVEDVMKHEDQVLIVIQGDQPREKIHEAIEMDDKNIYLINGNNESLVTSLRPRLSSYVIMFKKNHSEDNITLIERYFIKNNGPFETDLGFWSPLLGLEIASDLPGYLVRRSNLKQTELINVRSKFLNPTSIFFEEVLLELASKMNFTIRHTEPNDSTYGRLLPNGTWTGLVGHLVRNEADLSSATLTQTVERMHYVDFGLSIVSDFSGVVMRKDPIDTAGGPNPWAHIAVMKPVTWTAIAGMITVIAILSALTQPNLKLDESLAFVLSILIQRDFSIDLGRPSTKFTFLVVWIFGFIIYSTYTALLTSSLTTNSFQIRSVEDLLDRGYKVYVTPGTKSYQNLKSANIVNIPGVIEETDTEWIKNKLQIEPKAVWFNEFLTARGNPHLVVLKVKESFPRNNGFMLTKSSEFSKVFFYQLLLMEENGILERMQHNFSNRNQMYAVNVQNDPAPLGYEHFIVPFGILGLGAIVGTIIFVVEFFNSKIRDITT